MLILVLRQQNQNNQKIIKGIKGIKGFESISGAKVFHCKTSQLLATKAKKQSPKYLEYQSRTIIMYSANSNTSTIARSTNGSSTTTWTSNGSTVTS